MNAATRETIRRAIDERARRLLRVERMINLVRECRGCGGTLEARTVGCKVCSERHRATRRRVAAGQVRDGQCRGCGVDMNERTRGCRQCTDRMAYRKRMGLPGVIPA